MSRDTPLLTHPFRSSQALIRATPCPHAYADAHGCTERWPQQDGASQLLHHPPAAGSTSFLGPHPCGAANRARCLWHHMYLSQTVTDTACDAAHKRQPALPLRTRDQAAAAHGQLCAGAPLQCSEHGTLLVAFQRTRWLRAAPLSHNNHALLACAAYSACTVCSDTLSLHAWCKRQHPYKDTHETRGQLAD